MNARAARYDFNRSVFERLVKKKRFYTQSKMWASWPP